MPSSEQASLKQDYPWSQIPLVSSAPMRLVAGPLLAHAVSQAGGLGFVGAGSDVSNLKDLLEESRALQANSPIAAVPEGILPVGVGFINWGAERETTMSIIAEAEAKPAAVWFFAPREESDLKQWTDDIRKASNGRSKIWIQVGTVKSALGIYRLCRPDVLVIQGSDAGGHGLANSSSIITLLPEVADALTSAGKADIPLIATGGIMDGRGVAAALMLGASGVCMGTRFLVSPEAETTQGYKDAVLNATDGGVSTVRSKVYDALRGTTSWPEIYNGRGVINKSYIDWQAGMDEDENKRLYNEAIKLGDQGWGAVEGRLTTYAGTGVGLARQILPAGKIVEEVLQQTRAILAQRSC